MTASLLLRPRWLDPAMFLYDGGSEDAPGGMDAFPGGNSAANQCRNLISHPASLPPGAALSSSELPAPGVGDAVKQCRPCSATRGAPSASLSYGYFGSGYYPCRMPQQSGVKAGTYPSSAYGEKYMDTSIPGEEFASRAKEFTFYQSYAAGPYQPVPSYLDLSGPAEPRHEPLLPGDSYQPWALGSGWGGQVYCGKEQPPPSSLWKSRLPGTDVAARSHLSRLYACVQVGKRAFSNSKTKLRLILLYLNQCACVLEACCSLLFGKGYISGEKG